MKKDKIIRGIMATLMVITLPFWMIGLVLISVWEACYKKK